MTVSERITTIRRAGASRVNRRNKEANGRRVEEVGAVMDIERDYRSADRAGDLEMETHFSRIYQLADDDEERAAAVAGFLAWEAAERREVLAVQRSVEEATALLKVNNDFWLGSFVPDGDGGAA